MCPRLLRLSILGLAFAATSATATLAGDSRPVNAAVTQADVPVRLGCPSQGERVGIVGVAFDDVVAAAPRVLYREVTHYHGRRERRSAINTPVVAVVIELGETNPPRLQRQRALLAWATRLCGKNVARSSSAVMFQDGLSPVCCLAPITLFVVRTDRSLRIYPWPHG